MRIGRVSRVRILHSIDIRSIDMAGRFTLGIEEEFQLVDRGTLHLSSAVKSVLEKGAPYFEEKIKPELTQSTIELISDICPDIAAARKDLYTLRALLAKL